MVFFFHFVLILVGLDSSSPSSIVAVVVATVPREGFKRAMKAPTPKLKRPHGEKFKINES